MNDERQLGLARRLDMDAEALCLDIARAQIIMIIEPRLADADHSGMARDVDELARRHVRLFGGIMRMRADGAEDIPVPLGDRQYLLEFPHPGADRQHEADACFFGASEDARQVLGEARIVEMAMAVDDDHAGTAPSLSST